MQRFEQTTKRKVYLTGKDRVIDTLLRMVRALSELMYSVLFTSILMAIAFFLIIFQLVIRYESLLGHDYIDEFTKDLYSVGVYDLPCGGGIITNPIGVSRWLRLGYGRKGAISGCVRLLSEGPLTNDRERLVVSLATSVLYRLGNLTTIDRLQGLRNELLHTLASSEGAPQIQLDAKTRLAYVEALVAGLCQRYNVGLPTGISPLNDDGIRYWFY